MPEDHDLLAAELAFGLLEGAERIEAERLRMTDGRFAAQVAQWETHAQGWLGELPDHLMSPQLWTRVADLIAPDATDSMPAAAEPAIAAANSALWPPLAIAASLAAVLFGSLWFYRPGPLPQAPRDAAGRFSVAQIAGAGEPHLATALYDRDSGTLIIRIAAIAPEPGKAPEIWFITGTHPPHSLGFGQAGTAIRVKDARLQNALTGSATLAITLEPVADHPHAAPSSKILGTGTISTI